MAQWLDRGAAGGQHVLHRHGPGRPQARVATISITTEYQFNTNIHFYSMRRNLKILDFSWKRNKLVVLQRADKGGPRCSWSHFLAADE